MISKELLSEVLGFSAKPDSVVDNTLWYDYENDMADIINIYELAHKCKEWAITKDFSIKTTYDFTHTCFASVYGLQRGAYINIEADSEPGAIFKACQWILYNKDRG